MRRRIYYIIFAILLLIGLTPWVDGILFKKNFRHMIEVINQDNRVKIEILEYHQGWISSDARVRITLAGKGITNLQQMNLPNFNFAIPTSFILEEKIQHGPIIYNSHESALQLGYAYVHNTLLTDHAQTNLIQIDILSGFNNKWKGQFVVGAASFSLPSLSKIEIADLKGKFTLFLDNESITRIKTTLETGTISITGDTQNTVLKQLIIQPIKAQYDAVHEMSGLWSGSSSIYTPGFTLTQADNANFIVEKFAITNTFSVGENTFYNTNLAIFMKTVTSPSYTIPSFSKLQIILSAKNFSTKALNDYINFMKSTSPEELKNIDLNKIESLLAHTITPRTTLEGNVSSDTSLGSFAYRSKTKWPANTPLPNTFNDIVTNSFTKARLKLSNLLVVKLLNIYGDQITATTDAQVKKYKEQAKVLEEKYFSNQRASNDNDFRQRVNQLLKQGKISLSQSLQIMALAKQNQPQAVFSSNIDQLNLPSEIKAQLKAIYTSELESAKSPAISDKTSQLISDLISIGYLKKDGDDYISKMTAEHGIWQIYGSPLLPQDANTDDADESEEMN